MNNKTVTDQLKDDNMSLEDKMALIDKMMTDKDFQAKFNKANGRAVDTPIDPAEAFACEGCQ